MSEQSTEAMRSNSQSGDGQSDQDAHGFWAFISYSHRDEQLVRRLHRALETYRVPKPLAGTRRGGVVLPRRLTPIFRDRDELLSSIAQRGFEQFEATLGQAWDDGRPDTVTAFERVGHAYLAFAGEQHGFRRLETIEAALQAELSFYGQVFGFTPPGVPLLELRT